MVSTGVKVILIPVFVFTYNIGANVLSATVIYEGNKPDIVDEHASMPNPADVSDLMFITSKGYIVGGEKRLSIENLNVPESDCSGADKTYTGTIVTV